MTSAKVAAAEIEAALARQRVMMTLEQLQDRLNPRKLALNAGRDVADAGTAALNASVDTVKRNPGPAAGFAAVAGLFLARHQIVGLFRRGR
ncbi:phosphatase [Sphingomonas sp. R86520]|uniref:phosphatase n=1 Tax=Sphingomonas sp. R86520 TaxID=3093859 RepID=UPI0036D2307F